MNEERFIADQIEGVPTPSSGHPLVGHQRVASSLLGQFVSGHMHHGILLTGPKGIGKSTLALRLTAYFLQYRSENIVPQELLKNPISDPVQAKISAGAHPNLWHLTRAWDPRNKRFKTQIAMDDIRNMIHFFNASRGEEGWRIAIIDSLDEMNRNGANAILKLLEEPPERTVFFVLAHSPGAVLPTIRSRCQYVPLKPLNADELNDALDAFGVLSNLGEQDKADLFNLSQGSVRRAPILIHSDGLEIHRRFVQIISSLPNLDWQATTSLVDEVCQRGKDEAHQLLLDFAETAISQRATNAKDATVSITLLARWAELWEKTRESIRLSDSYNLDRKQLLLNLFDDMASAARA